MQFMVIVRATKESEAGVMPDEKLLAAMGNYNEVIEIRQIFAGEDFGAEFTPELRAQEDRLRAEIDSRG